MERLRSIAVGTACALIAACGGGGSSNGTPDAAGTGVDAGPPVAVTGHVQNSGNGSSPTPLAGATVEVVGASPANQTTTAADGSYMLMVPSHSTVFVRASAASYLAEQRGFVLADAAATIDLQPVSQASVDQAAAQLGITFDTAKGVIEVRFENTSIGGFGATLSAAHDASFTCGGSGCAATNTTVANNSSLIFPNVATGTTTVTVTAPAGHTCTAEQTITSYHVDANVLTSVRFTCT